VTSFASTTVRRAGLVLLCGAPMMATAASAYMATQLLSPTGQPLAATSINAGGTVAGGYAVDSDGPRTEAFTLLRREFFDYAIRGSHHSGANAINEGGDIVGTMTDPRDGRGGVQAFFRDADGGPVELFANTDATGSSANGVNANRTVVGAYWASAGGASAAYAWQNGQTTWLGTLGGPGSVANAIATDGAVVGSADTATPDVRHAFVWRNGTLVDLGALGAGGSEAWAVAVGDWVVGASFIAGQSQHACAWHQGSLADLGTLGGAQSVAAGVNSKGTIVGTAQRADGTYAAFVWQNGAMQDLNALSTLPEGAALTRAVAINDAGRIVARGTDAQGRAASFLLTPRAARTVPEQPAHPEASSVLRSRQISRTNGSETP
jgi:probable HAF family extracellular repeat protein